jgi:hypothetical protein
MVTSLAGADGTQLNGSVGPGFAISLRDGSGADITKLDPGSYTLVVNDQSTEHNFHLTGPGGVNVSTDVDATGTKSFPLTLVNGTYNFICDVHPATMAGLFTVGTPPPATTPPPSGGGGGGGTTTATTKLVLTVTGGAVTLRTPAGKKVTSLRSGPASISVRDRSSTRGVVLRGAGASKSTTAAFVGTVTWKVTLSSGTLTFAGKPALAGGKVKVS